MYTINKIYTFLKKNLSPKKREKEKGSKKKQEREGKERKEIKEEMEGKNIKKKKSKNRMVLALRDGEKYSII